MVKKLWVQFPPGTSIFCSNDRKNSLLHFLFYGACEHRKIIKKVFLLEENRPDEVSLRLDKKF